MLKARFCRCLPPSPVFRPDGSSREDNGSVICRRWEKYRKVYGLEIVCLEQRNF